MTNDVTATDFPAPAFPTATAYFGNAAAGLMSAAVHRSVVDHLRWECEIGAGEALVKFADRRTEIYIDAARLLNSRADEIAVVDSGNAALSALLLTTRLQPGDRVLVDEAAWGGAIAMLGGFDGVEVDRLPSTTSGAVDLDQVRASIRSRTVLVLTTWCAATRGTLNPVREMGTIFSEAGIPYIVDACQVVGQRPVDVTEIKCSALFASGRKWLRGPRGTAILYVAREFLAATRPQLLDQFGAPRTDARRYERGEFNVAGQIGLGAAIKETLETDLSRIACRTEMLAIRLREGLRETRGLHLLDAAGGSGPIVGFYSQEMPTEKLAATLRQGGVTVNLVSTSYAPLSAEAARTDFVIRAAPQVYNKLEEVDLMIEIVRQSAVSRCM